MKSNPIAVLISDVHYSLNTLTVADTAFRAAIDKAEKLGVPLIDCGDLTNDKAILRAEVVNAMIKTFQYARMKCVKVYCLVGNHSLINEKGKDHALNFLENYATIIDKPSTIDGFNFIPYQTNPEDFYVSLENIPYKEIIIGHQGTMGGYMGDYVKDHSAIDPNRVSNYKVFLGHYHRHGQNGTTISIGNPYTLTFGEAEDGHKGYLVLMSDGKFKKYGLDLRRHIKVTLNYDDLEGKHNGTIRNEDFLWVQVKGTRAQLSKLKRDTVENYFQASSFKLDKVCIDESVDNSQIKYNNPNDLFDQIIDLTNESLESKLKLKQLWRDLLNETS